MHSFGITERYAVLTECPLVVNPLELARAKRPFIENYRWEPERGTPLSSSTGGRASSPLASRPSRSSAFTT